MHISFANSLAVLAYLSWRILKVIVTTAIDFKRQRQEVHTRTGYEDFSSDGDSFRRDTLRKTSWALYSDDISVLDNDYLNEARFFADTTETSFTSGHDFENSGANLDLLEGSDFRLAEGTNHTSTMPGLPLFRNSLPSSRAQPPNSPSIPTPTTPTLTTSLSSLDAAPLPRHHSQLSHLSTSCQTYSNVMNNSELSMTN